MTGDPIEGQVLLLTAAKASVPAAALPDLVERTQELLGPEIDRYRREYERLCTDEDRDLFLVPRGHWDELGEALDGTDRERAAVRRAHEEQLLRIGRRTGRESEFETALEVREPVVIGRGGTDSESWD
ncbi:hypothetical protein [Natrinema caseinilyticum]|uniref:hypothetical protein n=1 Tax=Natrinema caseinilyticum TaxID=2961570 RepID=UPI0020C338B4|nr:hypothetical protein [Natrinema caseinilyticum]